MGALSSTPPALSSRPHFLSFVAIVSREFSAGRMFYAACTSRATRGSSTN